MVDNEYYVSSNILGYKCQPEVPEDGPLQYILSLDPPLKITNYNFRSIDLKDGKH